MEDSMFFIGIILLVIGFIILYFGIYRRNAIQGAVSETSLIFLILFGLMDWKNNKFSISLITSGFILILVSILK